MENYYEVVSMLAVIYKKLDKLEREMKQKGWRSAPDQSYLDELRREADKINVR